jgi:hypothetical protein
VLCWVTGFVALVVADDDGLCLFVYTSCEETVE